MGVTSNYSLANAALTTPQYLLYQTANVSTNFKQVLTLASVTSTASQMAAAKVCSNLTTMTSIAYIKQRCHLCNEFDFW